MANNDQNLERFNANVAKLKSKIIKTSNLIEVYNKTAQSLKQAETDLQHCQADKEKHIKQWMDKAATFEKEAQHRKTRWQQIATEKRTVEQNLDNERRRAERAESRVAVLERKLEEQLVDAETRAVPLEDQQNQDDTKDKEAFESSGSSTKYGD
ncbi:hypothetical protein BDF19DRAFT_86986 [Syncephalis fuscata]|nr:hypothetical protein BDF19DRAFT_86986 [Syncephalis fuscata]